MCIRDSVWTGTDSETIWENKTPRKIPGAISILSKVFEQNLIIFCYVFEQQGFSHITAVELTCLLQQSALLHTIPVWQVLLALLETTLDGIYCAETTMIIIKEKKIPRVKRFMTYSKNV